MGGLLAAGETPEDKFGAGCGEVGDVIFGESMIYYKVNFLGTEQWMEVEFDPL
jgi:hypothetical protein